ncbi:hypothetical protein FRC03_009805 [Tulasnella sp. 419]|nr:hypothetical protein FRC03_009805 [Tulasnella sp. 419]
MHETEEIFLDGRIQRVYKNLPPSLRHVWIGCSTLYRDREHLVYQNERLTFADVHRRASTAADVFKGAYGIRKGDHVGIAMRNYPEWLVAWWACHLLGAVAVPINAWLPLEPLRFCISHTDCKLLIVDADRAHVLEKWLASVSNSVSNKLRAALVVRPWDITKGKLRLTGLKDWDKVMASCKPEWNDGWKKEPPCGPEDNAVIYFTSGTTGMPKGVLITQRGYLSVFPNMAAARLRDELRRGNIPAPPDPNGPQMTGLLSTPFFHVMGSVTGLMPFVMGGGRLHFMRKWDREEAIKIIEKEKIARTAGVPFNMLDVTDSENSNALSSVASIGLGGAPVPPNVAQILLKRFPNADLGFACPVNDFIVVDEKTGKVLPPNSIGEIWIRGPNIMKEYWKDPVATARVLTKDGWFKTGDIGTIDEEGSIYIKDRAKDIIIRGGENVDSTTVENALFLDPRILDVAAVGVPDKKLGELVTAVVTPKNEFKGKVNEQELLDLARQHLPGFAVPVMIIISDTTLERNAAGKVIKGRVREMAAKEWEKRSKAKAKAKL